MTSTRSSAPELLERTLSIANARQPRILIHGVGSHNGGAELLLKSAADRAHSWGSRPTADIRRVSPGIRSAWHLDAHLSLPRFGKADSLGVALIPRLAQSAVGLSTTESVAGVLDASGFAYGDRWSAKSVSLVADLARRWHQSKTPLVMLPQAFGPFERSDVGTATQRLLESASLVYARDATSLRHLRSLLGSDGRLRLAPDVSIGLDVGYDNDAPKREDLVYVVPNINLTGADRSRFDEYANSLAQTISLVRAEGLDAQLLIHSSLSDPDVATAVKRLAPDVRVVQPRDGWESKKLIHAAGGVVGGRFHALVSALSTGVPVTAHSWSHKYGELLKDFDNAGVLSNPFEPESTVRNIVSAMSDAGLPARLAAARDRMRIEIDQMWTDTRMALES